MAESSMKHDETLQLEGDMEGLTLERVEKQLQNLRQIDSQRARNLQIYEAKVQQLEEEKYQLDMRNVMEEAILQLLEQEQYKELTATVENHTRLVQQLKETDQNGIQEQSSNKQMKPFH